MKNNLDRNRLTKTTYLGWLRVKYVLQAVVAAAGGLAALDGGVGAGFCGLLLVLAIECVWRAVYAGRPAPRVQDEPMNGAPHGENLP